MNFSFILICCFKIVCAATQTLRPSQRKVVDQGSLVARSPGPREHIPRSRGSTPQKQRQSTVRSMSAPPKRPTQSSSATSETLISGLGMSFSVEEPHNGRAKLTSKQIDIAGHAKASGKTASQTGHCFDDKGHVTISCSGERRVSAKINSRPGSRVFMTAEAPGQSTFKLHMKGEAQMDFSIVNQYPSRGHARIQSTVWGKGNVVSSAQALPSRQEERFRIQSS